MKRKKRDGWWKNHPEVIVEEAQRIMQENNWELLPEDSILKERGYSYLSYAINKHGGFHNFRKLLGETSPRAKRNSWRSLEFTLEQARQIMEAENWNELPPHNILTREGYSNLASAIIKHHNGYNTFRKSLGENSRRVKMRTWQSLDFTIEQAQKFLKEHPEYKTLPGSNILPHLGYSSLSAAISKYHGGFHKFRQLLGEASTREKNGSWQNLEFCITQAKIFMREYGFDILPSSTKLYELGYSSLSAAITTYHGGYPAFRETLRQHMTGKSTKDELENLLESYAGDDE